jgi:pyridinium-3,5-bisthiocarboxylic acid mononucleotide nickel chelatase
VETKEEGSRSYAEIIAHIESLNLEQEIKKGALAIFRIMAEAESKVHGEGLESLHFHELGQEDAIADVIGACAAFHSLGFHNCKILCTPIAVGSGYVDLRHGKFPVPAPATFEILKSSNLIWHSGPVEHELLTPTGAAILAHFAEQAKSFPQMTINKIGYGAGYKDLEIPNVLRTIEGEISDALIEDDIEMIETNVDNVTGEVLGNLIENLLNAGAKDVCVIPATMKKGRSGHIIQAIAKPEDSQKLARKIIEETGSLGVRIIPVKHRLIAARNMDSVKIIVKGMKYRVPVKIARDANGALLNISAEFEDCKKISNAAGVPVKEVMRGAEEEARKIFV